MRTGTAGSSWIRFSVRWGISRSADVGQNFKEKKPQI